MKRSTHAIINGTLVVGTLDIADAFIYFGARGAKPIAILQSIAAGWLGASARTGGYATAALGLVTHYFIAFGIVTTFYAVSKRLRWLSEHPFLYGPVYGVMVYVVMNFVVIPLSAARRPALIAPVVANGLLIHAFGIGLPSALAARYAHGRSDGPRA